MITLRMSEDNARCLPHNTFFLSTYKYKPIFIGNQDSMRSKFFFDLSAIEPL